jgi:LDH2 family malate/lactate/ureidoglycolate dehydrogenase
MIGILGADLSGGRISSEIVPLVSQVDQVKGVGLLVLAIDPRLCAKSDALTSVTPLVIAAVKGKLERVGHGCNAHDPRRTGKSASNRPARGPGIARRPIEDLRRIGSSTDISWPGELISSETVT